MKLLFPLMMSLLLMTVLLPTSESRAVEFFSHSQRTRTKCSLPKQNYNYNGNTWPFTGPSKFGATAIAVAATDPTDLQQAKRVKPFHFRTRRLVVDHLTLDQVGLAIDTSGRIYASGRISHSGGDGGLIGNNVTVRIRAYVSHTTVAAPVLTGPPVAVVELNPAPIVIVPSGPAELDTENPPTVVAVEEIPIATPNSVTRIPPDAYRVWSSEHKFWVSRGRPQHVTLAERGEPMSALRHHFDQITHLEVELEYQRDR